MNIKGWLHPTNRTKRLLVGLFLGVLFCIQCTQDMQANKVGNGTAVISKGKELAPASSDVAATVDTLAKKSHVELLKYCLNNYRSHYTDYTCKFIKQETIRGRLGKEQTTTVKFMEKPFSVVMTWTANRPSPADRVIYVDYKYDKKVLCRPVGMLGSLVGTQKRDPWGEEAKAHSLKPITEFGMAKMTQSLIDVYEAAHKAGDCREEFGGYFDLGGRKCVRLDRYLNANPAQNYPAKKTETYIDVEYLVPVCVKGWDWNDKFSCSYGYKDIKFNMLLTENDFLPQSNQMDEPK
ncbi:MAG: DUF1571 domain-containing protein [Planctomycetota bacterium]|nr:DUF1571 domain-containing protein [Planctomycetota bacterium]